jgi:hypothetical protein
VTSPQVTGRRTQVQQLQLSRVSKSKSTRSYRAPRAACIDMPDGRCLMGLWGSVMVIVVIERGVRVV